MKTLGIIAIVVVLLGIIAFLYYKKKESEKDSKEKVMKAINENVAPLMNSYFEAMGINGMVV